MCDEAGIMVINDGKAKRPFTECKKIVSFVVSTIMLNLLILTAFFCD